MRFTDSHCHLDFKEFSYNRAELLASCNQSGIHRIVVPSVDPNNWQAVLDLSSKHIKIYKALGIHPWFLKSLTNDALMQLDNIVAQYKEDIIAIGEMGIDGKIAEEQNNLDKQQYFFETQLSIAKKYQLPAIIHHRKSHQHIVEILKTAQFTYGGIIHAFSGSYQQAKNYLDLGFKLGIGGTITYERAAKTIKTVSKLPIDAIVLETDAPSMPIFEQQSQHNSPLNILKIFDCLTTIRSEPSEILAKQLEKNINSALQIQNLKS